MVAKHGVHQPGFRATASGSRVRVTRYSAACGLRTPRRIWSSSIELEQGAEVALAEAVVALALDELEEDRADHGLGEHLQQDLGLAAVHHAFAVDQDAVALHARDGLGVAGHAGEALLVVGVGRARHEGDAVGGERVGGIVELLAGDRDVLDALALVALEVLLDLAVGVGGLVDGNADAAAGRGERARMQARVLALDVEEADLAEVEQVGIEVEPLVHVAAIDVVGEVVEVIEADAFRPRIGRAEPVELAVVGRAHGAVLVDEIDERAADALDGGNIQRLVVAGVGLGAKLHGVIERVPGVHDAPGHRRRARPVLGDEARRRTSRARHSGCS